MKEKQKKTKKKNVFTLFRHFLGCKNNLELDVQF